MRKASKTAIGRCKGIDGLILSATWKEAEYGTTSIWGSNRVLPERRTQIVCHASELLQSLFFDGRRVVPDERLLCYPTRNLSQPTTRC